jgi:hypothetical protein
MPLSPSSYLLSAYLQAVLTAYFSRSYSRLKPAFEQLRKDFNTILVHNITDNFF